MTPHLTEPQPSVERPLATVGLYAYNEARHIDEAIRSLLAQTYQPLEIVLSDDHSSDGTYAIMQHHAASYRGPHKIVLNRNTTNLGIGGQLNAICAMSTGELIVLAGGDDRSRPDRVERNVLEWLSSGRSAHSLFSSAAIIDSNGHRTGARLARDVPVTSVSDGVAIRFHGVYGASQALSRDVFRRFGEFHPRLKLEDNTILLRAMVLGGFKYIDEDLVDYRVHSGNTCRLAVDDLSFAAWRKQVIWQHRESVLAFCQFLWDLHMPVAEGMALEERSRSVRLALYRALEHQIKLEHYQSTGGPRLSEHLRELIRVAIAVAKVAIKSKLHWIDRRNAARSADARRQSDM